MSCPLLNASGSFSYSVCVLHRVRLSATPWAVAHQAPLSMAFPRPDSWSGLLFPSPGDLPDPRIELTSLGVSCLGRWILDHWHHLGSSSYLIKEKRNLFYSPSIYCRKRPCLLQAHTG